jgi:hypothetical protein
MHDRFSRNVGFFGIVGDTTVLFRRLDAERRLTLRLALRAPGGLLVHPSPVRPVHQPSEIIHFSLFTVDDDSQPQPIKHQKNHIIVVDILKRGSGVCLSHCYIFRDRTQ